jgi:hypothetical protein
MATRALSLIVLVLPTLLLSSCSDSDGPGQAPDTTPPTIASRSVAEGQTDVGLIERIDVTFSEDMDPTTVNDTTLVVSGRGPAGYVEYDVGTHTASLIPDTLRVAESPHRLVVADGVTDEAGNPLAAPDTTDFETGPFDCDHLRDYLDPNETTATAPDVETDRVYHTLAICGHDHDVYAFTLTEPRKVTFKTAIAHADTVDPLTWQMNLLRQDGLMYIDSGRTVRPGSEPHYPFTFLPGTYYADVFSDDDPVYVLYDLELETSEPCEDDAYEDNDFLDEASPATEGTITNLRGCTYDLDVFSIHLEAGQTLTATATIEPFSGTQSRRIVIMNPSGTWLSWNNAQTSPLITDTTVGETGTYYVSTRFWTWDQPVSYQLTLDASP